MIVQYFYDNVYVKMASENREAFIAVLDAFLPSSDGWRKKNESELRFPLRPGDPPRNYYVCSDKPGRRAMNLALIVTNEETMRFGGISPVHGCRELSPEEFNGVLREFREDVIGRLQLPFRVLVHHRKGRGKAFW